MIRNRLWKQWFVFLLVAALVAGIPGLAGANGNPEVLFVLDVSGSMGNQTGGVVKLEAAKNSVHTIAPTLSSKGINLGLMHFSGCGNVSRALDPGPNNEGRISQIVNSLSPGGGTPLAQALRQAGRQLQGGSGEKRIVLLSDGEETCGGDPVAVASQFASSSLKIHVIGFDVGSGAASQLRKIAAAGGGKFSQAQNAQQLRDVFEKLSDDLRENLLEKMRSCVELGGGTKESSLRRPNAPRNDGPSVTRSKSSLSAPGLLLQRGAEYVRAWFREADLVSPAYAQNLPGWVEDPSTDYPSSEYLTAVGSAPSLAGAKNKATQGLVEIFSQEIESNETMNEVTREVSTDNSNSFHQTFNLGTTVEVSASGELVGARIERTKDVFNEGRTTYYALAVLDKGEAVSNYGNKLREAREQLKRTYESAQRTDDTINRLRLLATARTQAAETLKYRGYLDVLEALGASEATAESSSDRSDGFGEDGFRSRAEEFGEAVRSKADASEEGGPDTGGSENNDGSSGVDLPTPGTIDRELNTLFQELSISLGEVQLNNVCPGSGFDRQIDREVSQRFTDLGFRTVEDTDGLIKVDGYLSVNYTTRARKSDEAIRWNLTLNLKNTSTDRTFASVNESRVTTGLDKAHVASRTRYEITDWIEKTMNKTIKDKLLST